mmetsp:Transcript_53784/g.136497  ORF Transcript_53784/g.136497 Transcript_53784/m.136497 type:complete len:109 (-) Transcript_53784:354-680(-)
MLRSRRGARTAQRARTATSASGAGRTAGARSCRPGRLSVSEDTEQKDRQAVARRFLKPLELEREKDLCFQRPERGSRTLALQKDCVEWRNRVAVLVAYLLYRLPSPGP